MNWIKSNWYKFGLKIKTQIQIKKQINEERPRINRVVEREAQERTPQIPQHKHNNVNSPALNKLLRINLPPDLDIPINRLANLQEPEVPPAHIRSQHRGRNHRNVRPYSNHKALYCRERGTGQASQIDCFLHCVDGVHYSAVCILPEASDVCVADRGGY